MGMNDGISKHGTIILFIILLVPATAVYLAAEARSEVIQAEEINKRKLFKFYCQSGQKGQLKRHESRGHPEVHGNIVRYIRHDNGLVQELVNTPCTITKNLKM